MDYGVTDGATPPVKRNKGKAKGETKVGYLCIMFQKRTDKSNPAVRVARFVLITYAGAGSAKHHGDGLSKTWITERHQSIHPWMDGT